MIIALLWILAAGVVATLVYVTGRLLYDIYGVVKQRRYDKSIGQLAPLWRDSKVIAIVAQVAFAIVIGLILSYLWGNFTARTDAIGLKLSFDFLDQPAGITIADNSLSPASTVSGALTAGFFNTLRIIAIGIPSAVVLGTVVGIARLSSNWLLRKLATGYVEFLRNIPPAVVIVAVWSAVYLTSFPRAADSWEPLGLFVFNNSRFAFPSVEGLDNFATFRWILLVALVAAVAVAWWRTKKFIETGTAHHRVLWGLGTFFGIAIVAFAALGGPAKFSLPTVDDGGRVYDGGIRMQMPYAAVVSALVLYTATHIAEIVRGSIQAVHRGQVEASEALALSKFQQYRFVILPQAMRIAFPPLINQFLNFSKNSSLALLIGFGEITSIITNLAGQSQPAPQLILILMLLYLVISLALSAIGNLANRRLQIVGR
ncbi:MAG: ABC transporter permease subunit [Ilumatobacter sp.]